MDTEQLIRQLVRQAKGENIILILDFRAKSAYSYHDTCADQMRAAISGGTAHQPPSPTRGQAPGRPEAP